MSIDLVDLTVHIDENLSPQERKTVEESLRDLEGIVSVHNSDETPHLTVVEYNPDELESAEILQRITDQGVHAELIGL